MALDFGFITRNYRMHLEFNGETTDSGIKPQNRMRRQDTGIKIPLMSKLKVLREVITNKLFHH